MVVVGAGFGGLAAAIRLRREGVRDVLVLEKEAAPGGTWHVNHYPGAETDAPSHLYCFTFAGHPWTRTHVRQAELRAYVAELVRRYDLAPVLRTGVTVRRVVWDEATDEHVVTLAGGECLRADAVVSAVGLFARPRVPELPGLADFRGPVLHTARWDDEVDLTGRRVAVLGTGSSAAQVVPALAGRAEKVVVFQRQPAWVLPKGDRDFTPLERRLYRHAVAWKAHRLLLYARQNRAELRGALYRPGTRANRRAHRRALEFAAEVFAARPDLRAAVTPDHPFGGKRAVLSSGWFEALARDDVELVPQAAQKATPTGLVDSAGRAHEVDAVVLATGFLATGYLDGLDVVGRHGLSLHDVWAGEPRAFLGLTVPGFPNFWMLYGPGTNGGLIMSNLQHQAAFAAKEIGRLRRGVRSIEVRQDVADRFDRWLQGRIAVTSFASTDNYFRAASGRVVTQWPDAAITYAAAALLLRGVSTVGRRRR